MTVIFKSPISDAMDGWCGVSWGQWPFVKLKKNHPIWSFWTSLESLSYHNNFYSMPKAIFIWGMHLRCEALDICYLECVPGGRFSDGLDRNEMPRTEEDGGGGGGG